jgi:hypothetical protein
MFLLCLVFMALDWELVPLAVFPFVFVFPMMLVAWNRGLFFSILGAGGLSLTRVAHELIFSPKPMPAEDAADALIQFFVLVLLASLTTILARQARQLRQRVQQLEGILPICAGCKSIRNESGEWLPLEGYIMTHTAAQFSHGFCPVCFKAYYGDLPPHRPAANNP